MGRFDLQPWEEPEPTPTPSPPDPRRGRGRRRAAPGTLWNGFASGMIAFVVAAMFGIGLALIGYSAIASGLPFHAEDIQTRASAFESSRILDRNGDLLYESFDLSAGRRVFVPLERMSPYLLQATIATEDANFYNHPGVDPIALMRAVYYAVLEGDVVSGASTIPQQLVKLTLLSPERSMTRKINEAILSAEVTRRFDKDEILELYLNELYYGNLAYGADAPPQTYFNKNVADLTLAEASLLAGLPQLPAYYDPYSNPERAKNRQSVVLRLMVENGYITSQQADEAWLEPLNYAPLSYDMRFPHFTLFVREQLETILGPGEVHKKGYIITTSLDPDLQTEAQRIVHEQVAGLGDRNVSNGALVAMRPNTGEILAFVGSADFDNVEIDGQVNMALAPRQPGSSTKPFVYLAAFEQQNRPIEERWTPGTLIADIEEAFPDGANPPYIPTNYDNRQSGMVTVRRALGSSYNIPAVRALQHVGLPYYLDFMRRLGVTTLTRPDYGLSLSLGGGEIPLLELTTAFGVLANEGRLIPPVTILRIEYDDGEVYCEFGSATPCQTDGSNGPRQVISPVDAFLITDILNDNEARTPAFGPNSMLRLNRPAGVKTGTTNDWRDNLTVGYTPQLVTGVWVGNADNSPMRNISGVTGAGPIWNEFMNRALANEPVLEFTPPPGVRRFEVCADTGTMPSEACPERRQQWYAEDRPPLGPEHDLYQVVRLNRETGQLANEFTPRELVEEKVFKIYPEPYREWAERNGIPQPPFQDEDVFEFTPDLFIRAPIEGEIVSGEVAVFGTANTPGFHSYELQYGVSHDPGAFSPPISGPHGSPIIDGILGHWDVSGLNEGPHTLRLLVRDERGNVFEQRARVFVEHPAPTPEPTATWTPEPLPEEPTPTDIPTEAPTATWTPELVEPTPTETPTAVPVETPTPEPEPGEPEPVEPEPVEPEPVEPEPVEPEPSEPIEPGEPEPTPTWTPVAEAEASGSEDDPLLDLADIDADRAALLRSAGVFTIVQVSELNPPDLAGLLGISVDDAVAIINEARDLSE
jgi:penicillin-binding protein 1C